MSCYRLGEGLIYRGHAHGPGRLQGGLLRAPEKRGLARYAFLGRRGCVTVLHRAWLVGTGIDVLKTNTSFERG